MTDWNIQSRAHACESCGKPFADQAPYHTLLFDEKAGFRRSDVCAACWQSQFSEGARDRKGFVSHWQGVYEAPPPPVEPIRKETAETLLRRLIELNDPAYAAAGYILAVMLERKRILKVKEQLLQEGRRVFVYEHPKSGDVFTIADPALRLDELEAVQHQVAGLMENGLDAPEAPAAQATVEAETAKEPACAAAAPAAGPVPESSAG
jgi:hypothetical protein